MNNNDNVRPVGLKGNNEINRMRELMQLGAINESTNKRSVLELTKIGPDGKTYGIVRENHQYFIKTSEKKENLVAKDFNYIGGLKNKNEVVYESYASAIKHLNLKFIGIQNIVETRDTINTFKDDGLTESFESYSEAPKASQPDTLMGTVKAPGKNDGHETEIINDSGESGNPDVDTPPVVEEDDSEFDEEYKGEGISEENDVELTESQQLVDKMINEVKDSPIDVEIRGGDLSILIALDKITEGANSLKKKI